MFKIQYHYNVAWEAIQKQKFLAENDKLAELFMTLMGTIIVTKDGVSTKSSKINEKKVKTLRIMVILKKW